MAVHLESRGKKPGFHHRLTLGSQAMHTGLERHTPRGGWRGFGLGRRRQPNQTAMGPVTHVSPQRPAQTPGAPRRTGRERDDDNRSAVANRRRNPLIDRSWPSGRSKCNRGAGGVRRSCRHGGAIPRATLAETTLRGQWAAPTLNWLRMGRAASRDIADLGGDQDVPRGRDEDHESCGAVRTPMPCPVPVMLRPQRQGGAVSIAI